MDKLLKVVRAVGALAEVARSPDERAAGAKLVDPRRWRDAYRAEAAWRADGTRTAVLAEQARAGLERSRPGRVLSQFNDPFVLEVHRPITLEQAGGLPPLPPYIRRAHDAQLARVVARVAAGHSAIAVLVAGSSAGKTRACWEALRLLRERPEEWRLWHPFDPTRPEAAVQTLDRVGPRTVVWLNETQEYLDGEAGERVAAKLRSLLADPDRAPVLVLGTLWPDHHASLTGCSGSQVRQVLDGAMIEVPETFTGSDLAALQQAAQSDARLGLAAERAEGGQITQYLAGGPALVDRFCTAPSAAKAVICAAMDARRMGHSNALPLPLLEQAALAYLTDIQYERLSEDWLEQALAYISDPKPCKGARGPITRIRPDRPGRGHRDRRPASAGEQGAMYRLADYLDQYGRITRADQIPPIGFWTAAAAHASPSDQATLGDSAWDRGLYRDAAQLHKNATTTHGNPWAARSLVDHLHQLHPTDQRPATHAATHVTLHEPYTLADLLSTLGKANATEQIRTLAERIAAQVPLDDAGVVADLLSALRRAGATDQIRALLTRAPAAHAALDHLYGAPWLLAELRKAGADGQARVLAERIAAQASLDEAEMETVEDLVRELRETGATDQVSTFAERIAAQAPLDDPQYVLEMMSALANVGVVDHLGVLAARAPLDNPHILDQLLGELQHSGATDHIHALLARDPATHTPLDHPDGLVALLWALRDAGATGQIRALLARDPATHTQLDDPAAVAMLLLALREVGAAGQVHTLLARNPFAHIRLDAPYGVVWMLEGLRWVGATDQIRALAARDPAAHATLDDPHAAASMLTALREAGAASQARAFAKRIVSQAPLHDPNYVAKMVQNPNYIADMLTALREAGAASQARAFAERIATQASLDDANHVAWMLTALREAGVAGQARAFAERIATQAPLHDPNHIAKMLAVLPTAGAPDQVHTLLTRDPAAHAALHDPSAVAELLKQLRQASAPDQVRTLLTRDPAAHAALRSPYAVADLLKQLQMAKAESQGASDQMTALVARLPSAGRFDQFLKVDDHMARYRFGREPDGRPADQWGWDDLE
ncbi:hypothetical protein [Actinocorallia populi]|uniref:hypothetical protein n=1 Tax=Actinocorallia populi TaxID=2079200 RepID=UPI0013006F85|nr:hypothetical protein [Actinocorallia populi]